MNKKIWYHKGNKFVNGIKIPKTKKTTFEFREKVKNYYKNLSKEDCENEYLKLKNLAEHLDHNFLCSSFSVEDRYKLIYLKNMLEPEVKIIK